MASDVDAVIDGRTVPSLFLETVSARPDAVALRWRPAGSDRATASLTWAEYAERAARVAAGLADLGVRPGQRVVLMMRNRPEFHYADMGVLLAGATPISIYNSSSPEQIEYLAGHSEASTAIVGDMGMLERFLKVRSELPDLQRLVVMDDPDGLAPSEVVPFADLLGAGPIDLEPAAGRVRPEDLLTLIYTSGTTGPPKGVMISNRNLCWVVESMARATGHPIAGWRQVSFLPMAHIAERLMTHYFHIGEGTEATTCPDPSELAS
ncbi:MAG TPA: AMP-binding protein, partial [Acidimicrobiia bacterium]|nr:AMP-binding protein [Acidimicrobiia bacterium]